VTGVWNPGWLSVPSDTKHEINAAIVRVTAGGMGLVVDQYLAQPGSRRLSVVACRRFMDATTDRYRPQVLGGFAIVGHDAANNVFVWLKVPDVMDRQLTYYMLEKATLDELWRGVRNAGHGRPSIGPRPPGQSAWDFQSDDWDEIVKRYDIGPAIAPKLSAGFDLPDDEWRRGDPGLPKAKEPAAWVGWNTAYQTVSWDPADPKGPVLRGPDYIDMAPMPITAEDIEKVRKIMESTPYSDSGPLLMPDEVRKKLI